MKHNAFTVLACSLALAFSLCACSGGVGIPGSDPRAEYAGEWTLESGDGENSLTADDVAMMGDLGLSCTLTLTESGEGTLDLFGDATTGTWEMAEDGTATLTINGSASPLSLSDGKLTLGDDGGTLIFTKATDSESASTSATSSEPAPATTSESASTSAPSSEAA